ncbi:MAG TPA: carbon-nitrogen hydrolase family protein, partial [Spirochaetia bacterium]|nr:carbon-nitrogen hydrolase family protein [Spirochaetia bacterium]
MKKNSDLKNKIITVSALGPRPLWEVKSHGKETVDIMIRHWQEQLSQVTPDNPDLIVLPEACDRFPTHTMTERKEYYHFRGDKILNFFCEYAVKNKCYIVYSAVRETYDGTYRNSTQLINRQGTVCGIYNKNHLVPRETTEGDILCGKDAPVFTTDFGTVAMAICFDLNFHELLEKYAQQRPDIILFSSMYHGGLMQNYWAYYCQAH